jgi:hypothetical protein
MAFKKALTMASAAKPNKPAVDDTVVTALERVNSGWRRQTQSA